MKIRDQIDWLAYHALRAGRLTASELAAGLGVDPADLGRLVDHGERLDAPFLARRPGPPPPPPPPPPPKPAFVPRPPPASVQRRRALELLFADGAEHTSGEVAAALAWCPEMASRQLKKSSTVERVRRGVWRKAGPR